MTRLGSAIEGAKTSGDGAGNPEGKIKRVASSFESPRAQAMKELLSENLQPDSPIIYLYGETNEPLVGEEYNYDLESYLSDLCVERGAFDVVLRFNAASNQFSLGAQSMSSALESGLKAEVKAMGNKRNLIGELLDRSSVNPTGSVDLFLNLARQLLANIGESNLQKGILFVVDNAEHLFPSSDFSGIQGEKAKQVAQIKDLKRQLTDTSNLGINNQLILIDRSGETLKESVSSEFNPTAVPALDATDLERIFTRHGFEYTERLERLVRGLTASVLNATLAKSNPQEDITRALIKEKERQIEALSGGLISCSYQPFGDDMIAFNPGEQEVYEQIAGVYQKNPAALSNGILLMGPPGTGKTVRPRWIASRLEVPYLQVRDMGVDGLRGKKGQKLQKIFDIARLVSPCVLYFDEINKHFPNTEKAVMMHEDDAETEGILQSNIGSDSMQGVLIIGSCNEVGEMSSAMLRSGRFGTRLAVLPPTGETERIEVFQKIKNQIPGYEEITLEDSFISIVLQDIPDYATGADYKNILEGALLSVQTRDFSIQEAILQAAKNITITEHKMFTHYVEKAQAHHSTVVGNYWKNEPKQVNTGPALDRLMRYEADLQARHAGAKEQARALEAQAKKLQGEIAKLESTIQRLEASKTSIIASKEKSTQTAQARIDQAQQELEELQAKKEEVQRALEELQAKKEEFEAAQTQLESKLRAAAEREEKLDARKKRLDRRSLLTWTWLGLGTLCFGPLTMCSFNMGLPDSIGLSEQDRAEINRRKKSLQDRLKTLSDSGEAEILQEITIQGRLFSPTKAAIEGFDWLAEKQRYALERVIDESIRLVISIHYDPPHNFVVGFQTRKDKNWVWDSGSRKTFFTPKQVKNWVVNVFGDDLE